MIDISKSLLRIPLQ